MIEYKFMIVMVVILLVLFGMQASAAGGVDNLQDRVDNAFDEFRMLRFELVAVLPSLSKKENENVSDSVYRLRVLMKKMYVHLEMMKRHGEKREKDILQAETEFYELLEATYERYL